MYLKFESTTFIDSSKNHFVGVMGSASITVAPGKLGNSLVVSSNAGGFRTASNTELINRLSFTDGNKDLPFTISMWVKKIGHYGTSENILLAMSQTYLFQAEWNCYFLSNNRFFFRKFQTGTQTNRTISTTNAIPLNEWVHIVYSDNGIGNEKIYINGIQIATTITDGGYVKMGFNSYGFGIQTVAGAFYGNTALNGAMDDILIIKNYALNQEDVNYLYNNGNGRILW